MLKIKLRYFERGMIWETLYTIIIILLHITTTYLLFVKIPSLTVVKVKMPFKSSVLPALRAFLFRFETKKIVFYFPLLYFCIVLVWLFAINSKSVLKWQASCSLSVSSVLLYRGIKPCSFTYAKWNSFKVFRISSHVYLCSKKNLRYL